MGAGYQVVLEDLQDAASAFTKEAGELDKLAPRISPPAASGGDASFDAVLQALLETFGVYATEFPKKLREHGDKLQECHDNYHRTDADLVELYNDLMSKLGG